MYAISVIVPVYNADSFLEKCIESILNQTFRDFELLIINDGSIDNSIAICQKYKNIDNRITIITQENSGVSAARNKGLSVANGKWIMFIDADDYVEPTMLEKLYSKGMSENADIVFCDFYYTRNNIDRVVKINFTHSPEIAIQRILNGKLQGFMHNKLIKKSLYSTHNIRFDTAITMGEDMLVLSKLLLVSTKLAYYPEAFNHYVQHNDSCVAVRGIKYFESQKTLVIRFESLLCHKIDIIKYVEIFKVFVKKEMLLFGNFSHEEIKNTYPEVNDKIDDYPSMNIFERKYLKAVINKRNILLYALIYKTIKKILDTSIIFKLRSY